VLPHPGNGQIEASAKSRSSDLILAGSSSEEGIESIRGNAERCLVSYTCTWTAEAWAEMVFAFPAKARKRRKIEQHRFDMHRGCREYQRIKMAWGGLSLDFQIPRHDELTY
jgi:hypothetical protein